MITVKKEENCCNLQISPTDEQIEQIFRYQLNQYQLNDARIHYEEYLEENDLQPDEQLDEEDFQGMVEQYNDQFDANIAENDLWYNVMYQYFQGQS